jgi:hypothetical protein
MEDDEWLCNPPMGQWGNPPMGQWGVIPADLPGAEQQRMQQQRKQQQSMQQHRMQQRMKQQSMLEHAAAHQQWLITSAGLQP